MKDAATHRGPFRAEDVPPGEFWIPVGGSDRVAVVDFKDRALQWEDWVVSPDGRYVVLTEDAEEDSKKVEHISTSMHRVIMKFPEGLEIDHIDGDGFNNRRNNLRIATRAQNGANRGKTNANTSGYKGVSFRARDKRWVAMCGGRYLGYFLTAEDAAKAYDQEATARYGRFAKTNAGLGLLAESA